MTVVSAEKISAAYLRARLKGYSALLGMAPAYADVIHHPLRSAERQLEILVAIDAHVTYGIGWAVEYHGLIPGGVHPLTVRVIIKDAWTEGTGKTYMRLEGKYPLRWRDVRVSVMTAGLRLDAS